MAERPQGFARRMMAQQLASDARADPFSDSRFFSNKPKRISDFSKFGEPALGDITPYQAGATGSLFLPGAGIADYFGKAPDPANPGQLLPGFSDNVQQGKYIDAVMQTGGAAGDVAMAAGALFPPAFPAAAALSTLLKGPRAGRLASGIDNAVDATRGDPNQVAGSAMDAAQARYFETGKFEPPTADNPVSIMPPTETEPGIIAFHGSGADFDEFRLEMIGTGEGAQAYGYGLYFTDSEDIAKFYKDAVGGKNTYRIRQFDDIGQALKGKMPLTTDVINNIIDKKIKVSSLPKEAQSSVKEILKRKKIPTTKKMYKVGLAPKPDELLDYDASFSAQSKDVQEKLLKAGYEVDPNTSGSGGMILDAIMSNVGREGAHLALGGKRTDARQIASQRMAEAGIPGIRYATNDTRSKQFNLKLDVRGKPYDIGTEPIYARNLDDAKRIEAEYKEKGFGVQIEDIRKSNYVIFDDKAVKILEKYGIVGPVAITAGVAGAARSGNDNEDGGSILPDAGIM